MCVCVCAKMQYIYNMCNALYIHINVCIYIYIYRHIPEPSCCTEISVCAQNVLQLTLLWAHRRKSALETLRQFRCFFTATSGSQRRALFPLQKALINCLATIPPVFLKCWLFRRSFGTILQRCFAPTAAPGFQSKSSKQGLACCYHK